MHRAGESFCKSASSSVSMCRSSSENLTCPYFSSSAHHVLLILLGWLWRWEILLLRYTTGSTYFKGLPFNGEMALFWLKKINCFFFSVYFLLPAPGYAAEIWFEQVHLLFALNWRNKVWIHVLPKGISTKWNANCFVQELN